MNQTTRISLRLRVSNEKTAGRHRLRRPPTNPSSSAQRRRQIPHRLPKSVTRSASNIRDLSVQNPTPKIPKSVTSPPPIPSKIREHHFQFPRAPFNHHPASFDRSQRTDVRAPHPGTAQLEMRLSLRRDRPRARARPGGARSSPPFAACRLAFAPPPRARPHPSTLTTPATSSPTRYPQRLSSAPKAVPPSQNP